MKTIVVTQRCFNPNRPKTPVSNREHVRYIATRTGVVRNEGMSHGLFGKAFGMQEAGDIGNLDEFKQNVRLISQNKTNVYRAVISLTESDALQKGFDKRENWQQLIENNLSVIAEKMRIKIENLDWCAAVHMDKGHPHVHFLYWDRQQGVRNSFIHPAQSNAIRLKLNKYVFADEFAQLYKDKQTARDATAEYSMDALSDALLVLTGMEPEEYKRLALELAAADPDLCAGTLPYSKIPMSRYAPVIADLVRLSKELPKTGRLSYKLMPPEIKARVDDITKSILAASTDCKREFDRYIQTAMDIARMHTSKDSIIEDAGRKAFAELSNRIGNQILKTAKELSQHERSIENEQRRELYRQQAAEQLVNEIFSILSSQNEHQQARVASGRTGELSKQAKKELAMKLADNNIDWER